MRFIILRLVPSLLVFLGIVLYENPYFLSQPYLWPTYEQPPDGYPFSRVPRNIAGKSYVEAVWTRQYPFYLLGRRWGLTKFEIVNGKVGWISFANADPNLSDLDYTSANAPDHR